MNYYGELINTVFATLTGTDSPSALVLSPSSQRHGFMEQKKSNLVYDKTNTFELNSNSIPNFECSPDLFYNEDFFHKSIHEIANSKARCLFAFPPIRDHLGISPEFELQFRNFQTAQILAICFSAPRLTPEQLSKTAPFLSEIKSNKLKIFACLTSVDFIKEKPAWREKFFPHYSALIIEHHHDVFDQMVRDDISRDLHDHPLLSDLTSRPQFCTVVFQKKPGKIRFFKIDKTTLSHSKEEILTDVRKLLTQPEGKTKFGFVYSGEIKGRYPTTFDLYSEQTQLLRDSIKTLGDKRPLSTIAQVIIPTHRLGSRSLGPRPLDLPPPDNPRVITHRNITPDGQIDLHEPAPLLTHNAGEFLIPGDICISLLNGSVERLKAGVFFEFPNIYTCGPHSFIAIIRPDSSLDDEQRFLLLQFLRSKTAWRLLTYKGVNERFKQRHRRVLEEFPVPVANHEITAALRRLEQARSGFTNWINEIDDAVDSIVMESSAAKSSKIILSSGQLARQRYSAGQQVEDLDYRIRTLFPLPIAHLWREVQVSGTDELHRLRAIKKAAEGHTCFMAQLAILLGTLTERPIRHLSSVAKRLQNHNSGTNFGDWFSIVKEACDRKDYKTLAPGTPLEELTRMGEESNWEQSIRHLMGIRNDDDHCRLSPHSTKKIINEAQTALESIYLATEFLTDYRLISITDTQLDSIRFINRYQYLNLIGDNPLAKRDEDFCNRQDLEKKSLYLRDRLGSLHLLRPLLHYLECPECHQMATFYFDRFDKRTENQITLKSIERNSVRHVDQVFEFTQAGFLPSAETTE